MSRFEKSRVREVSIPLFLLIKLIYFKLFIFTVNIDDDVCGCDQGTCDCNKETQRSFCTCFKGFEGISLKLLS